MRTVGPVRVKICGITRREDAETAVALGADALGFNLFKGSKRFISLDDNADWICELPPFVTRVAVLVNAPLSEACRVADHRAIDLVQLHGEEDVAYCAALARAGRPFIKVLRARGRQDLATAAGFSTRYILLDAHVPGAFGGTGTPVDLTLAVELTRIQASLSVILAGGLKPEGVATAVRKVRPFAVDVASGVEVAPGIKDYTLMAAFIEAAKGAAR